MLLYEPASGLHLFKGIVFSPYLAPSILAGLSGFLQLWCLLQGWYYLLWAVPAECQAGQVEAMTQIASDQASSFCCFVFLKLKVQEVWISDQNQ